MEECVTPYFHSHVGFHPKHRMPSNRYFSLSFPYGFTKSLYQEFERTGWMIPVSPHPRSRTRSSNRPSDTIKGQNISRTDTKRSKRNYISNIKLDVLKYIWRDIKTSLFLLWFKKKMIYTFLCGRCLTSELPVAASVEQRIMLSI